MALKFYVCKHCGNLAVMAKDSGVRPSCCGEAMQELVANTTDAAQEKHVPVIAKNGDAVEVSVGSAAHPMADVHWIEFVALETSRGMQMRALHSGEEPRAEFCLAPDEELLAAYAYCNLHGLWKAEA